MLAKTLAEEKAWKFAKEDRTDLVTINPGLVLGPFFQPKLIFSVEELKFTYPRPYRIVDILHANYPSSHLPEKFEDDKYEPTYQISKERAKSLGINFVPWEASLKDTVESFLEKGFLHL
ncbi:cinnamoyl-CoA reductase 1-like [Melia azedarach]|uniref:Cinnamoyl-CoA reductase 1-like n=1 Tax=Melia azedarach TaxID=155640 RepID=A0ACC1XJW2_MELAZ|nr:cinnamoyl-CoA reductase 1-like [Melia azedarach]